jgi:hypothetical protein
LVEIRSAVSVPLEAASGVSTFWGAIGTQIAAVPPASGGEACLADARLLLFFRGCASFISACASAPDRKLQISVPFHTVFLSSIEHVTKGIGRLALPIPLEPD